MLVTTLMVLRRSRYLGVAVVLMYLLVVLMTSLIFWIFFNFRTNYFLFDVRVIVFLAFWIISGFFWEKLNFYIKM